MVGERLDGRRPLVHILMSCRCWAAEALLLREQRLGRDSDGNDELGEKRSCRPLQLGGRLHRPEVRVGVSLIVVYYPTELPY